MKVLEEGLRTSSTSNGASRRQSLGSTDNASKFAPNGFSSKRVPSLSRSPLSNSTLTVLKHAKGASKSFDGGSRLIDRNRVLSNERGSGFLMKKSTDTTRGKPVTESSSNPEEKPVEFPISEVEDSVSGLLYDMLQKEVVVLRKACHEKDQSLKDKDDAIEVHHLHCAF